MTEVDMIEVRAIGGGGTSEPPGSIGRRTGGAGVALALSSKERFALLDEFATMLDSGIQIPAALQSLRGQCAQPRPTAVLSRVEQSVLAGRPLSDAMQEIPKAFPEVLTQMVRAGERSGCLPEMVRRAVEMLEAEAELRAKLRSAMLYPCIMVLLTVGVVVFLLTAIVPKFDRMFRGKEAVLPTPTKILMALGDFSTAYGLWVLVGVAALMVGLVVFVRTAEGRRVLDRVLLKLPVIGAAYRTSVLARSARTLGLLVEAGVPVHVALEHARDVAGSPLYVEFWEQARLQVVSGGTLTDAIRSSSLVSSTFKQIAAAGESTACLDQVMLKTAAQYIRDLERRIRDLVTLVEPLMVVIMGGIVGFIALSIMLPIFRLSRG